jgi:hypothetical protein
VRGRHPLKSAGDVLCWKGEIWGIEKGHPTIYGVLCDEGENKRLCRESRLTMRGTLKQTAGGGPGGRFSPFGVAFGSLRVRRLVVNRTVE